MPFVQWETWLPTDFQPMELMLQGVVTHIGAVQIAATGVKTWSNGQATSIGVRSNGQAAVFAICTVL